MKTHFKFKGGRKSTQNSNTDKSGLSETDNASKWPPDQALIYPPRLSDNQKILGNRYPDLVAPEDRQQLFDELRFLNSLCKAAQQGEFVANLGIKVLEARQSRRQAAWKTKTVPAKACSRWFHWNQSPIKST